MHQAAYLLRQTGYSEGTKSCKPREPHSLQIKKSIPNHIDVRAETRNTVTDPDYL